MFTFSMGIGIYSCTTAGNCWFGCKMGNPNAGNAEISRSLCICGGMGAV